jgi:hypothetical protein
MGNEVVNMAKWKRRRAGRKRKLDVQRYPSGDPILSGPDKGTPELQAQRQHTTGDPALSPDYPLHILHGRKFLVPHGHLTGGYVTEEEAQRESAVLIGVGMAFAARYWRLFGRPFASGMNYERFLVSDRGALWDDPVQRLRDQRQYEAEVDALHTAGALALVNRYCVRLERDWFIQAVAKAGARVHRLVERRDLLLKGLRALAAVPRVRLTEAEILKAQQEAA